MLEFLNEVDAFVVGATAFVLAGGYRYLADNQVKHDSGFTFAACFKVDF